MCAPASIRSALDYSKISPGFIASLHESCNSANSPLGLNTSTRWRFPLDQDKLSLTLLMLCDFADHAHLAMPVDDLALVTNLLD